LKKREEFAVHLRKQKKTDIINAKRRQIAEGSSMNEPLNYKDMLKDDEYEKILNEIYP
jgi:hypothetical protein